ncbi:MAG: DUF3237 family protein [Pseudomonadales bacterium]|nr:DUF3237 family protein [Pseudomonadales bacterium]
MAQADIPVIELEYAFSIRINTGDSVFFQGPMRSRSYEPVAGGEIFGPRLQGRVVAGSGADFASNGMLDAHFMLQAADGTWIYVNQLGYEHAAEGEPYFRVTPYFDTPTGPHDWLGKTVFVGTGIRGVEPDHILYTYYALL